VNKKEYVEGIRGIESEEEKEEDAEEEKVDRKATSNRVEELLIVKPRLTLPLLHIDLPKSRYLLVPYLRVQSSLPISIGLINAVISKPGVFIPKLRVLAKQAKSIKVNVLPPNKIKQLEIPLPLLQMVTYKDISIRSLLDPFPLYRLEILTPRLSSIEQEKSHNVSSSLKAVVDETSSETMAKIFEREATSEYKEEKEETVNEIGEEGGAGLPPLLDFLFDESFIDKKRVTGIGSIVSEGPVLILVDKDREFHKFVKLLCAELWRIKSKGHPKVNIYSYSDELNLPFAKLSDDIIEIENFESILDILAKNKDSERIQSEFISKIDIIINEGRLRFVLMPVSFIINGKNRFDEAYRILTETPSVERYVKSTIFLALKSREFREEEEKYAGLLLRAMYGFAEIELQRSEKISEHAFKLRKNYIENLGRIIEKVRQEISASKWPMQSENESWLHYALKHLVYSHLLYNENAKEDCISSEEKLEYIEKIPDITYRCGPDEVIAVEIETMYGTGDPLAKINETVKPYYGKFNADLWLVVPNLQAFIFAHQLLKLRDDYVNEGLKLEIYVTDVTGKGGELVHRRKSNPGLIKLREVLGFLDKTYRELKIQQPEVE
jgi:hypothetical protein